MSAITAPAAPPPTTASTDPWAYLSVGGRAGEWAPVSETRVPVLDRGFIFGDGVYEVVPVYDGKPFRIEHHLARFERSMRELRIDNPHTRAEWAALVAELALRNRSLARDVMVYLQVTRGVAKRDHAFPKASVPTVFGMANPWSAPTREQIEHGIALVSMDDNRWLRCDIKATALLGNVLARQFAVDHGAAEVVMFRDGLLTEGSAANIWVVAGGTLRSPPSDHRMLEGIRVRFLEELARDVGVPFEQRPITRAEVASADELLVSSASREVIAATRLDGRPVGAGVPGPVWQALYAAYQRRKA